MHLFPVILNNFHHITHAFESGTVIDGTGCINIHTAVGKPVLNITKRFGKQLFTVVAHKGERCDTAVDPCMREVFPDLRNEEGRPEIDAVQIQCSELRQNMTHRAVTVLIPSSPVPCLINQKTFRRDQVFVIFDIDPNLSLPACI